MRRSRDDARNDPGDQIDLSVMTAVLIPFIDG